MLLCVIDIIHLLWRQLPVEVVESVVSGLVNKISPKCIPLVPMSHWGLYIIRVNKNV